MIKKLKFSLVLPVYKTEKFLDRCLQSIDDQDYKNFEKIIVVQKDNQEVIDKAKANGCSLVLLDEDAGAPHARNMGAEVATGDIIYPFDTDSYMNPGVLQMYYEAFRDNPEADFCYTSYEIVVPEGDQPMVIGSRDFDAYALTCNNFITGNSPIKKEAWVPQDETLKSLQDWDMWLTLSEQGSVGKYLPEFISFKTEPVRIESVSHDSYVNWIERRNQVRNKHKIADRSIAVISLGAPQHGLATAKILGADFYPHPIHKANTYRAVYLLGFYPNAVREHMMCLTQNVDKKAKKIIHWIGTDVYGMHHQVSFAGLKDLRKLFKQLKVTHFSEFKPTHDELMQVGIKSEIVPLPPEVNYQVEPMPKKFSVGVYINPTQDMYYENEMYDVARAMPDVRFKFFGNKFKKGRTEENMEWVGYVDMDKFIRETSCNLRITKHDGLPLTPVQFLMKGRYVVTNVPIDYTYQIDIHQGDKSKAQIIKSIREVMKKKEPNTVASKYYNKLMDHKKFINRINAEVK